MGPVTMNPGAEHNTEEWEPGLYGTIFGTYCGHQATITYCAHYFFPKIYYHGSQ